MRVTAPSSFLGLLSNWLAANVAMAVALAEKHDHYRFRTGTEEHYPPAQAVADYPDALRWLWRGYELPR